MQRRTFIPLLFSGGGLCLGQENPAPSQSDLRIVETVDQVIAHVTVQDKTDVFVNGIEPREFTLYDNGKVQNIRVEATATPISLVIAIQANDSVEPVLPMIKKIGPLIENLVIGGDGEAAIIKFDHRIENIQPFTNDGRILKTALDKINAGSSTARSVDAVFESARLLRNRPNNRRKIILLISETRDNGSEGKLREALTECDIRGISVHTVNINRAIGMLTKKMPPPRQDPLPPGARPVPNGAPMTPNTTEALTGYRGATNNWIPVFVEIFRDVKSLFVSNHAEVLTRYTGGREHSFINQRTLETAIAAIGEELHSQYMISYRPNNPQEGGYHEIRVTVARPDLRIHTRDGYYRASRFDQ